MFKKILVGIDTSAQTQHAFEDALSIAKATGATLSLLHVFSWDDAYDRCQAMLYSELQEIENNEEMIEHEPLMQCLLANYQGHEQSEILIKFRAQAQQAGVRAEIASPRRGKPGRSLCVAAKIEQADLIVVGHRDRDWGAKLGLGEFHLGSVSHEVMLHAHCSVLIARRFGSGVGTLAELRRMLVALDDSAMGNVVFQEALDLAQAAGASLTLLHILSAYEGNRPLTKLQTFADRAVAAGVAVNIEQIIHEDSSIGTAICAFAQEKTIDLVAIGRRRLLEVQNAQLLGSVSNYIAYHAPCAVAIVQPS